MGAGIRPAEAKAAGGTFLPRESVDGMILSTRSLTLPDGNNSVFGPRLSGPAASQHAEEFTRMLSVATSNCLTIQARVGNILRS
jgi:hypothetical protein